MAAARDSRTWSLLQIKGEQCQRQGHGGGGGVQSRQDPEPFEKRGESRGRTRPTNQEVK